MNKYLFLKCIRIRIGNIHNTFKLHLPLGWESGWRGERHLQFHLKTFIPLTHTHTHTHRLFLKGRVWSSVILKSSESPEVTLGECKGRMPATRYETLSSSCCGCETRELMVNLCSRKGGPTHLLPWTSRIPFPCARDTE